MDDNCSPTDITITTPMGDCTIPFNGTNIKGFIKAGLEDGGGEKKKR